jgi:hypothetical protein
LRSRIASHDAVRSCVGIEISEVRLTVVAGAQELSAVTRSAYVPTEAADADAATPPTADARPRPIAAITLVTTRERRRDSGRP